MADTETELHDLVGGGDGGCYDNGSGKGQRWFGAWPGQLHIISTGGSETMVQCSWARANSEPTQQR
eukprot:6468901-Lingulodinium_polyedra.AAC.1